MMTTTEMDSGQRIDAAAGLEPPPAAGLSLTMDDQELTREAAPKHGWPGSLFVLVSNLLAIVGGLAAVWAGLVALMILASGEADVGGRAALVALSLALGCVLQRALATHVGRFSRWGWYGAMAELGFLALTKANAIVAEPDAAAGAIVGIVIDLLWMGYFWKHRADFDVDIGA